MSEINNSETVENEVKEIETPDTTEEPTLDELKAQVEHWKSFSRTHEKSAKENAEAARKLKEIEDQNKTELDKALERVNELELELNSSSQKALRASIIAEFALDPEDAAVLLTASDEEGLRAQAERLAAKAAPRTPKVTLNNSDLEGHSEPNSKAALGRKLLGL